MVAVVVLAEDEVHKFLIFIDDRQRVEFIVPDELVGVAQRDAQFADGQFVERRHMLRHLVVQVILVGAVVAAGNHTQ